MNGAFILIVDDEPIARENLEHILKKEGYGVTAVDSGGEAIQAMEAREFDLVMTDLRMKTVDGIQVLERAKALYPTIEVIVITGYATVATAVAAMQKGAYHYLAKPYDLNEVRILVRQALEKRSLRKEVKELRLKVAGRRETPTLIGQSHEMEMVKRTLSQIAPTDCNVLILGETGTGKELVARLIHELSFRREQRFLAVNCGAFTEDLLANELFGHEKEAFTGARGVKKGLLEAIRGGTLLLDEIGDMPLSMQVKLLRVIQERCFLRVGGTEEIPVDIRILAATNKDLKQEVEQGVFRQDLYYRLNVISLRIPLLSERKEDIPLLCRHMLDKFNRLYGKQVDGIADEVMRILMCYEFPGNVRELENIMERAVALAEGKAIETGHLPTDIQHAALPVRHGRKSAFMTLEENEIEYIAWILKQVGNNKTRAAEILGIDRVSLWRKLRRNNMEL